MSKQWQIRRGTTAENNGFTGAQGEITMDTDKNQMRLHDGVTQGGDLVGFFCVPDYSHPTTFTSGTEIPVDAFVYLQSEWLYSSPAEATINGTTFSFGTGTQAGSCSTATGFYVEAGTVVSYSRVNSARYFPLKRI